MYALLLSWCLATPPATGPVPAIRPDTPVTPARKAAPPPADTIPRFDLMGIVVSVARTSIPLRENPAATTVVARSDLAAMPRGVAVDEAVRGS